MESKKINLVLDQITEHVETENTKRYWMVRTDDGANYDTFSENGFVALNLRNYPIQFLTRIEHDYPDVNTRMPHVKEALIEYHKQGMINLKYIDGDRPSNSNVGRLASQITTMAYLIKKGDIVLIPDHGANRIKIGKVEDDRIFCNEENIFSYARKVRWIQEINKKRLDPCLYKALGAHQAICDITKYSEYIERNYNSFFNIDDKFHYVLAVNAENISAWKLSCMVYEILQSVKTISEENNLGINVEDINFTINVNSPGKFSFITTAKNAALIMAVVTALSGGTIRYRDLEATTGGAFNSLVESVNLWKDAEQARDHKNQLFDNYMQSLDLNAVEAANDAYEEELRDVIENENIN